MSLALVDHLSSKIDGIDTAIYRISRPTIQISRAGIVLGTTGRSRHEIVSNTDSYGVVTVLAFSVTAVCASALPVSDAPVFSTIAV